MHLTYCNAYVPTEVGFNLLTKAIYGISGFENYLLVFAIFAFFTVLLFLQAIYRQAESFGFSFFLFMAFGYYFQSFSTVRYYLALAVALIAIPYLLEKEYGRFLVLILIGAAFHKSVLVVLVLYPLAVRCWKKMAACTGWCILSQLFLSAGLLSAGCGISVPRRMRRRSICQGEPVM